MPKIKLLVNLVPGVILALFSPALSSAETVLGKCAGSEFGLSNDGQYIYRISQEPFSNTAEISVLAVADGSLRHALLEDLPITNKGTAGIVPPWDNRVGGNNLFFYGKDQTVSVFSLATLKTLDRYSFKENTSPTRRFVSNSAKLMNKVTSMRLKRWIVLSVTEGTVFERAIDWKTGEIARLRNRQLGFYSIPFDDQYLIVLEGKNQSCFVSNPALIPICRSGKVLEITDVNDALIVRLESETLKITYRNERFRYERLLGTIESVFFDVDAFQVSTDLGRDVTAIFVGSNSSLLYNQPTFEENLNLIMLDKTAQAALLVRNNEGSISVSLLQKQPDEPLQRNICE